MDTNKHESLKAIRPEDQPKVDALCKIREVVKAGFGGCLSNGNIVDRREHPEAIPIQQNSLLGVPKPKSVPSGKSAIRVN